ncbi:MAG: META domain-containing protein [Chloroflexota bacterium]
MRNRILISVAAIFISVILFFSVYSMSSSARLTNKQWVLVAYEINGELVEGPPFYASLNFSFVPSNFSVSRFSRIWEVRGTDGCNRFSSSFGTNLNRLRIGSIGKTNMSCDIVKDFIRNRNLPTAVNAGAYRYQIRGDVLTIFYDENLALIYSVR